MASRVGTEILEASELVSPAWVLENSSLLNEDLTAERSTRSLRSSSSSHSAAILPRAMTAAPDPRTDWRGSSPAKGTSRLLALKMRQQEMWRASSAPEPGRRPSALPYTPIDSPTPLPALDMEAASMYRSTGPDAPVSPHTPVTGTVELQPCKDPDATMKLVLAALSASNAAQHTELDWQAHNKALSEARRLVLYHGDVVGERLQEFVALVAPAVDALRSQVARNAMRVLQEVLGTLGRVVDACAEAIVAAAAKRAGEISRAGRENMLTLEADSTLAAVVAHLSASRAMQALLASAGHKNPAVRAKIAQHMDACMRKDPAALLGAAPGLPERLFVTAAGFLEEGSPEARASGRRVVWTLQRCVLRAEQYRALLDKLPSAGLRRRVEEVVENNAALPPALSRAQSSASTARPGSGEPLSSRSSISSQGSKPSTPATPPLSATGAGRGAEASPFAVHRPGAAAEEEGDRGSNGAESQPAPLEHSSSNLSGQRDHGRARQEGSSIGQKEARAAAPRTTLPVGAAARRQSGASVNHAGSRRPGNTAAGAVAKQPSR